jgi:hypothetical protein
MVDNAPPNTDQNNCPPPPDGPKKCPPLDPAPTAPELPPDTVCPQPCDCPTPPGGTTDDCLDKLIRCQAKIVKQADRAKALVDELTEIQGKVVTAKVDYTQKRYGDLKKLWEEQDKLIAALTEKVKCSVPCWECLLECRLCPQLTEIRNLEDRLNGKGPLTDKVYSLLDLQFWHQRNVAQMEARVKRIKDVLAAWEKPSATLGDALDKNGKLLADLPALLATDAAKAIFDIFMTLVPRHMAIRPRDATTTIKDKFINICCCPEGTPDDCCGPDVGVLKLRERLVGLLPYIVDPANLTKIICCITKDRLEPASTQLADAQANLAAVSAEIEQTTKLITDKTAGLAAAFTAELANPIDCGPYKKKEPPTSPPQTNQTAR